MTHSKKYTRKSAVNIMAQSHPGFDRSAESDQASHGGFRPPEFAGQHLYGLSELVALDYQLTLRREGYPVKLAGAFANRLYRAMAAHPAADRVALVTLENRNRFALPVDEIDLSSGYSSGSPVREALIVDVRNFRERIARLIEAAARIVGAFDES